MEQIENKTQINLSNRILKFLLVISSIIILLGSISLISSSYSFYNINHIKNYYLKVQHEVKHIQELSSSLSLKYSLITSDGIDSPLKLLEEMDEEEDKMMLVLNHLVTFLEDQKDNGDVASIIDSALKLKEHIVTSQREYEKLSIALIEDDFHTVKSQTVVVNQIRNRFHFLVFKISEGINQQFAVHVMRMNKVTVVIFITTILIVALSILITLFSTNRLIRQSKSIILKPINLFEQASRDLAGGNFEGEINPDDAGELSDFATQFNIMKQKLSASQNELKTFNAALDRVASLIVLNRDFTIREFNSNFLNYTDADPLELEGVNFITLSCTHVVGEENIEELMNRGEAWKGELVYCNDGTNPVWTDTAIVPVFSGVSLETIDKFIIISFDISERKRAEQDLKNSEEQLQITNRLAALGEFSSGIAHEINNPLVIISSTLSVIKKLFTKERLTDEQLDKYIKDIDNMVFRISRVTSGLKMLAQRDISSELEPINPEGLFSDVQSVFLARLEERFIDFRVCNDIPAEQKICSNRAVLAETLVTLVTNSIDAVNILDEKWIQLCARFSDQQLILEVTDSGTGLSADIAEKIFNPLFTTKRIGTSVGAGMGLSTARQTIESIGGSLYLNSDCEHTCFVITVPQES